MLDMAPSTTPASCWRSIVSAGDIVAFRFPCTGRGPAEEPKVRPCLVLEIREIAGQRFAEIAYGTSAGTAANRGLEIDVKGAAAVAAAGLQRPTRFVGARRIMVRLDHPGFDICDAIGSPVIGRLSGKPFDRMHAVRARIQAERDMAAERRKNRGFKRTIVVEYRRSRRSVGAPNPFAVSGGATGE